MQSLGIANLFPGRSSCNEWGLEIDGGVNAETTLGHPNAVAHECVGDNHIGMTCGYRGVESWY